nr:MAG TPA: helix-turn-helix domain-containing protein [Caudoviricetes sp.]
MNEKAVLLSIQPKWCGLIALGKKTIEVRKTRPKIETPFKCYIYQSKSKDRLMYVMKDGDENYGVIYHGKPVFIKTYSEHSNPCEQKVIGEFVCDRIIDVDCDSIAPFDKSTGIYIGEQCCLSREELWKYTSGHCAHGWHISDLKIYNKPKELSEFGTLCDEDCPNCEFWKCDMVNQHERDMDCTNSSYPLRPVKRPPQSWCYVEAMGK